MGTLLFLASCSNKKVTEENCFGTYVRTYESGHNKMVDSLFIHADKSYRIARYKQNKNVVDKVDSCLLFLPEGVTFSNFIYTDSSIHDWDANIEKDFWGNVRIVWNGENDDCYIKINDQ